MMYICERCGEVFDEDQVFNTSYITDYTPYGRVKLARCDDLGRCEHCGGEVVPAKHCEVCGAYVPEDGPDICDCCIEDAENVETALKLGDVETVTVELNGFIASLGIERINEILKQAVKSIASKDEAKKYINSDLYALTDFLVDEKALRDAEKGA